MADYRSCVHYLVFFFYKQKPAYEVRISDWSSDVCSSDLAPAPAAAAPAPTPQPARAEPVEAPSSPPTETKKDSPSTSSGQTEKGNRVKASPLAKRLAAEQGIDLKTLTGTGPGGRIVRSEERRVGKEGGRPGRSGW